MVRTENCDCDYARSYNIVVEWKIINVNQKSLVAKVDRINSKSLKKSTFH